MVEIGFMETRPYTSYQTPGENKTKQRNYNVPFPGFFETPCSIFTEV